MAYDPNAVQNALIATQKSKTPYGGAVSPYKPIAAPAMTSGDYYAKPATTTKPKTSSANKTTSTTVAAPAASPTMSNGSTSSKGLQAGYNSPAWYTDEWDRQRQNAQQYAKAGIQYELKADPKTGVPSINYAPGQNMGAIDADVTGGTFDYYGYSNNPNFLKATIGLSREEVNQNELLKGLSDRALYEIYTHGMQTPNLITGGTFTHGYLGGNMYWNPYTYKDWAGFTSGGISTHNGEGAVSVTDVRNALAELTGQKANYAEDLGGWWGGQLVPFVKPDYYNQGADLGARQQAEVIDPFVAQIRAGLAANGNASSAVTPSAPTATPSAPSESVQGMTDKEREKWLKQQEGWRWMV
jgi:hypothetical protein